MAEPRSQKTWGRLFILFLWAAAAWLLYPLLALDSVDMSNAKAFLFRTTAGLAIMLIFFGKTVFDLLFPHYVTNRMTTLNTVLLSVYCIILAGGLIFMFLRWVMLFIKSRGPGILF